MKTLVLGIIILTAASCSKETVEPQQSYYTNIESLECHIGQSCQDVYEFDFEADTEMLFDIKNITGSSVIRYAIYAPGIDLGGDNLLNETIYEVKCTDKDKSISDAVTIKTAGVYKLTVTRDWGLSSGLSGYYTLEVFATKPFKNVKQIANDKETLVEGKCFASQQPV